MKCLVFQLNELRYATDASQVKEAVQAVAIQPLPKTPEIVEGIFSYRGRIVPVLDIRSRFRLAQRALTPSQSFIIAEIDHRLLAIRVDEVQQLIDISADDIEDARQAVPDAQYIAGVAHLQDGLVLIHDLSTFLSAEEAADLQDGIMAAEGSHSITI